MNNNTPFQQTPDALDDVVAQLLQYGGAFSLMLGHMVDSAKADSPPINEVAHGLIRSACEHLRHEYSKRDLKTAARIVQQITDSMCSDIYVVSPELIAEVMAEEDEGDGLGGRAS